MRLQSCLPELLDQSTLLITRSVYNLRQKSLNSEHTNFASSTRLFFSCLDCRRHSYGPLQNGEQGSQEQRGDAEVLLWGFIRTPLRHDKVQKSCSHAWGLRLWPGRVPEAKVYTWSLLCSRTRLGLGSIGDKSNHAYGARARTLWLCSIAEAFKDSQGFYCCKVASLLQS